MDNWNTTVVKQCSTCMFYVSNRCRRHAPTLSGYPAVFSTDFCGDHKISKEDMKTLDRNAVNRRRK